jgi:DUF1009 family protein
MRYGLIAGNGKFPFLVAEGARRAGVELAVAAIKEETDPAIERVAERVTWVGIGQLGRMIRFFKREGVEKAIMAGQVKHVQIFSGALPDVRMLKMLISLPRRNTDALIGGVAAELAREGIELIDSTYFLQRPPPAEGVLSRRAPDERERGDIEYGLEVAREIARLDLGQTIVVRARACVAVEAMEGTDATVVAPGRSRGAAHRRQGREAESGHALRRARRRRPDRRDDGRGRRDLPLHNRRQDPHLRPRRDARPRQPPPHRRRRQISQNQ